MSDFSLGSFDLSREIQMEKYRAQEAERRLFGSSVLAEIEANNFQPKVNHVTKKNNPKQTNVIQDKIEVSKPADKNTNLDDGKISFKEKIKNFGKGIVAPIKNIFASPKNIAITAATALGCAALIGITGGAAAPVLVAAGLIGGGVQIIKGIQKQAKATTDAQAEQAWQDMGSGTFTVGVSALGAKSSLKAAGTDVTGMSALKAAGKCITDVPKNISTGFSTAKANIANFSTGLKTPPVAPTSAPSAPTSVPSVPTSAPSAPTSAPSVPTSAPSVPTSAPTMPTVVPSTPTVTPTTPTSVPTTPTVPTSASSGSVPISSTPVSTVPAAPSSIPVAPVGDSAKPLLLEAPKQQLLLEAPKTPIYNPYANADAKLYPQLLSNGRLPIYKPYEVIDAPSLNSAQNKPVLLLEAPKGDVIPESVVKPNSATAGVKLKKMPKVKTKSKHNHKPETGKVSFWEKFKDFFRVFGFFKENPTVDCL